jgi:hypothetical protein
MGPARRPRRARPTNSSVLPRTHELPFILDSSVGVVTGPHAGDRAFGIPFSTAAGIFCSVLRPDQLFGPVVTWHLVCGVERPGVKLAIHLHLLPRW